jgi:hypothetical protein
MTLAVPEVKTRRMVMKIDGKILAKGEMRAVPVDVIKVDSKYQRDLKQSFIHEAGPYDPTRATTVVLSSRAGGPYCIDGGHRIAIARASGISHVNAFVIDGLTQADEANLFVKLQRMRRALSSYDLFRAEDAAGDLETRAMIRVVHNAGFRLVQKAGGNPTAITAIDSVRYIHRYGGDDLLSRTLELVKEVWFSEPKALSGPTLKGLALFLHSAGQEPNFRRERLIAVMRRHGPMKVERLAQGIAMRRNAANVGPGNFAEAIHVEYNRLVAKGDEPLPPLKISGKRRPGPRQS